jgi:hypothetical protein
LREERPHRNEQANGNGSGQMLHFAGHCACKLPRKRQNQVSTKKSHPQ